MLDWVVIVHEYIPHELPAWLQEAQPPPRHTHYAPILMSQYVPIYLTLFVAETANGEIPIFSAPRAERALQAYTRALPPRFEHPWLPISTGPHDIKPYHWLLDHFDIQGLHSAHLYYDRYITSFLV